MECQVDEIIHFPTLSMQQHVTFTSALPMSEGDGGQAITAYRKPSSNITA